MAGSCMWSPISVKCSAPFIKGTRVTGCAGISVGSTFAETYLSAHRSLVEEHDRKVDHLQASARRAATRDVRRESCSCQHRAPSHRTRQSRGASSRTAAARTQRLSASSACTRLAARLSTGSALLLAKDCSHTLSFSACVSGVLLFSASRTSSASSTRALSDSERSGSSSLYIGWLSHRE